MSDVSTKTTLELIRGTLDDFLKLLRKEFELLKVGLIEALTDRLKGAGLIAVGAIIVFPGLMFLLVALALVFPGSPAWGFFTLGLILLVAAGIGIWFGLRLIKRGGKDSNEALDRVKEDARWARERVTR